MSGVRNRAVRIGKLGRKYVLLVLAAALVFSSFSDDHNIDSRLLVHAIGIDSAQDGYDVSFQVFRSTGSGSDIPIDISMSNVQLIKVRARTVTEAVEKCSSELGREAFLGHLQVICFGSGTDLSDPEELFSFAVKDKSVYLGVELCQAENMAEDIIMKEIKRGTMSSENLVKALKENAQKGRTTQCTLLTFLSCIDSPNYTAMPVISISEQGEGDNKEPVINITGTALISEGKTLPQKLSAGQAYGLTLLRGKAERFNTVIEKDGRSYDVRFENASSKCRLALENGKLFYRADITLTAALSLDIKKHSGITERELEDYIEKLVLEAWDSSEGEGCDAVGVWKYLRQRYPEVYLENREDLAPLIKGVTPEISVSCEIE